MYELNTVEDVTKFVTEYKKSGQNGAGNQAGDVVQEQIDLVKQFNKEGIKGYVMKAPNETIFQNQLRKDLCVQYLTTSLTGDLFKAPIEDYTEVVCLLQLVFMELIQIFDEDDKKYGDFNSLVNPNQELSGYVFDPIDVDLMLQVKARGRRKTFDSIEQNFVKF